MRRSHYASSWQHQNGLQVLKTAVGDHEIVQVMESVFELSTGNRAGEVRIDLREEKAVESAEGGRIWGLGGF